MSRTILRVVLSLALVIGVSACGDDDDDTAAGGDTAANVLRITAREYEFDVEGDVDAGALSIAVANDGAEFHELAMSKLADGKTLDDARAALENATDDHDEDPLAGITEGDAVIDDLGGAQAPGTEYAISGTGVEAGDYVLMCYVPNAEGESHYTLGMLTGFTIGEGEAPPTVEPDVTYTASDEGLEGPDTLDAGDTTIEIVNDSSVSREIVFLKIKDGRTVEEVGAFFESAEEGPPDFATAPLEVLAFVFDAEQDRSITIDLTPGQWALTTPDSENPFEGPPDEDPHGTLITVS